MLLPHGRFLGTAIESAELSGLTWKTSAYEPYQRLQRHSHATANFCLLLRGGFADLDAEAARDVSAGDVAFWAAQVPHAQNFSPSGGTCFNISFPTQWLSRYGVAVEFGRAHAMAGARTTALCRQLYRECQYGDALSSLAIEGLALQLVAEFARTRRYRDAGNAPRWLARVVEIIEAGHEPLTLPRLADEVNVEPARLARVFRKVRGISVLDCIQRNRIERACHALLHTSETLSSLALRLGYFDQSHFTRVFKKATGLAPGAYRRQHVVDPNVQ